MPSEVRTFPEGTLRVVQASGSGRSWATAASPVSALIGYVQAGFNITSARTVNTIMERGLPDHHKFGEAAPPEWTFSFKQTGTIPSSLTASGASVPMWHVEHRASAVENGPATGVFNQLHGGVVINLGWTENPDGNVFSMTLRGLAQVLATGSGWLST